MNALERGMIIDVRLDPTKGSETGKQRPCIVVTNDEYNKRSPVVQVVPITGWSERKSRIITNVEIIPDAQNGLTKKSVADCLQTRPVDQRARFVKTRGRVDEETLSRIGQALKILFDLD